MVGTIEVILDGPRNGAENMALDRRAFARAESGQASLRVYDWAEPTVTLGRSQTPADVESLFPNLPTVGRPTGGGAVLHGWDVTIAAALPLESLGLHGRRLRAIYRVLVEPLAAALSACGLPCAVAGNGDERQKDCFASVGAMDLIGSGGHKVAGCAMAVSRGAVLLHASVPARQIPALPGVAPETIARYRNQPWDSATFLSSFPGMWRDRFEGSNR